MEFVDLAGHIEEGQPVFPTAQDTQIWTTSTHEEGGYAMARSHEGSTETIDRKLRARREGSEEFHPTVRSLLISEHGPTHVDAPSHLDPTSERSVDTLPLERFFTDAVGVDVSHVEYDEFVTAGDIERSLDEHGLGIETGDAVTLHTGHRAAHYSTDDLEERYSYLHEYTGLDRAAAEFLGERGVDNVGVDAPSIDHADARARGRFPAHDVCAEYGMLNVEQMANLDRVAGERFTLCAFPLKIRGGTGSPIRPVAILEG